MIDPVSELKRRARLFEKRLERGDEAARKRLRELRDAAADDEVKHKHALALIARELGFSSYAHAARVLSGDRAERDFGTFMHTYGGFLNSWFVDYDEARAAREASNGFLIGYKRQYVLVESGYVEALGLSASDPDWAALGRDLVSPLDDEARLRLYAKRLRALPDEGAA